MTAGTIGRRQLAFVNQILDAVVAIDAVQAGMDGFLEGLGREQEGDVFAIDLAGGGGVEMAAEAIVVLEFLGGGGSEEAGVQKENESREAERCGEGELHVAGVGESPGPREQMKSRAAREGMRREGGGEIAMDCLSMIKID